MFKVSVLKLLLNKWNSVKTTNTALAVSKNRRAVVLRIEHLETRSLLATLGLGDIAFTGYQSATPDKVSIVLLKAVDAGTVLSVTDNAWSGSALNANEGSSVLTFNGDFAAGTQLNFDATRTTGTRWAVGSATTNLSDATTANFALAAAGDNLFAYNGSTPPTAGNSSLWVAAFATNPFLASGVATTNVTFLPAAFASTNAQLSLGIANGTANENGVYSGGDVSGTPDQIRTAINSALNWTTFTTAGAQTIPPSAIFTVQAGAGNSAPSGLTLSNTSILENAGVNAIVGTFNSVDANSGDTFAYTLVSGAGSTNNASFNISGNILRATSNLSPGTLSIRVRTTDPGGLFFEEVFTIQVLSSTRNSELRIVSYNIAAADSPGTPRAGLNTILQAIGTELVNGISRPIDLLALQEVFSQSSTTQLVVNMLNSIYGAGTYARGILDGGSIGSGTQGVVYNTQTLQLLNELAVGTFSSGSQPRQTTRYRFLPVGGNVSTEFYVYNSHWKANNDAPSEAQRLIEAQAIRDNADALGDGKNILYVGDFNVYGGTDNGFQFMIGAGNGQARDPVNRIGAWNNNSSFVDLFTQAPSAAPPSGLVGGGLDDRFDFQLTTSELFDGTGLDYRTGSYHTFGNNGSVPVNGSINSSGNSALPNLSNRTQVLNLLTTVSDHLPVVVDYSLPVTLANPVLSLTAPNSVYTSVAYAGASWSISGAASPVPTATLTYFAGANTNGVNLGSTAPINVGTYTVIASTLANSGNNSATSSPVTFQITAAPLIVTAESKSKTIGQSDPALTFITSSFVGGETAATALTGNLARAVGESLGSYPITQGSLVSANGNYAITFVGANFTINAAAPAPTLTSVVVNGADTFVNSAQRSMVTSLTVAFSSPVTLTPSAFSIVNVGLYTASNIGLASTQIMVSSNPTNDVYTIRFGAGPGVQIRTGTGSSGNSLVDGNYRLSIDSTKVSNAGGSLSGNNVFGGAAVDNFFRLYGDANGDGRVDGVDLFNIRTALAVGATYNAAFDWDGNGSVSIGSDTSNFSSNQNRRRRLF